MFRRGTLSYNIFPFFLQSPDKFPPFSLISRSHGLFLEFLFGGGGEYAVSHGHVPGGDFPADLLRGEFGDFFVGPCRWPRRGEEDGPYALDVDVVVEGVEVVPPGVVPECPSYA